MATDNRIQLINSIRANSGSYNDIDPRYIEGFEGGIIKENARILFIVFAFIIMLLTIMR